MQRLVHTRAARAVHETLALTGVCLCIAIPVLGFRLVVALRFQGLRPRPGPLHTDATSHVESDAAI